MRSWTVLHHAFLVHDGLVTLQIDAPGLSAFRNMEATPEKIVWLVLEWIIENRNEYCM
jgi:hypothetical protein